MKAGDFGNFLLRIVLGGVFLYNAIANLFLGGKLPVDEVLPLPKLTGLYIVGLVELVIGVFLLIGLVTRVMSWLTVLVSLTYMGSTVYLVARGEVSALGLQIALTKDLLLLGAGLYLGLAGSLALGVDNAIHKHSNGGSSSESSTSGGASIDSVPGDDIQL